MPTTLTVLNKAPGLAEPAYHALHVNDILERSASSELPFKWMLNPYVGCAFDCVYCFRRDAGHFLVQGPYEHHEGKVLAKHKAAELWRSTLEKASLRGEQIAIGTTTDPYQPAEERLGLTRSLLEIIADFQGLEMTITTKAPLITRDIDLLIAVAQRHTLTINVSVTTLDAALARQLEPMAPDPEPRFEAIARLAEAGLNTRIFCMPILPRVNDAEEQLRPIYERASKLPVIDVFGHAVFFTPAVKSQLYAWFRQTSPELVAVYDQLFDEEGELNPNEHMLLAERVENLRQEFGFPRERLPVPESRA
jgi:DNA repair photolyase